MEEEWVKPELWFMSPASGKVQPHRDGTVWLPYRIPLPSQRLFDPLSAPALGSRYICIESRILPHGCPDELRGVYGEIRTMADRDEASRRAIELALAGFRRQRKKVRVLPGDFFLPIVWLTRERPMAGEIYWPTSSEHSFHFCIVPRTFGKSLRDNGVSGVSFYPIVWIQVDDRFFSLGQDAQVALIEALGATAQDQPIWSEHELLLVTVFAATVFSDGEPACVYCGSFNVSHCAQLDLAQLQIAHRKAKMIPPWGVPSSEIFWSAWFPDGFICDHYVKHILADGNYNLEWMPLEIGILSPEHVRTSVDGGAGLEHPDSGGTK